VTAVERKSEGPSERELDAALARLEAVLAEETAALRNLDRDAIDRISAEKLALSELLTALGRGHAPAKERAVQLRRIRRQTIHNQVLLVHARDSVRGVLAILTGQRPDSTTPPSDGRILHVRC